MSNANINNNKLAAEYKKQYCDDMQKLYSICEKQSVDECIEKAEMLLVEKYIDNSLLQSILSSAYYAKGNRNKTICFLK